MDICSYYNNQIASFDKRKFGVCLIMICGWLLLLTQPALATPPLYPGMGGGHKDDVAPMHHRMAGEEGRLLAPGAGGIGGTVYTTGTVSVIALMVEFPDIKFTKNQAYFQDLMDKFARYYHQNSYGKMNVQWTLSGTYTLVKDMTYYGKGDLYSNGTIDELITDAVKKADENVNFRNYNALIIIHAGQGEESSGEPTDIHSQFVYSSMGIVDTKDNIGVFGASIVSEHEGLSASPFGIFCHEFGHQLGLPDLYDTTGSSEGIGNWSLMSAGAWNGSPQGSSPAHFDAWCKVKADWIIPQTITTTLIYQPIPQAETSPVAYKLWNNTMDTKEYFLVENRQGNYLPGKGLLIWHVDENQTNNDDPEHYMIVLEQADGLQDLENNQNRGDAGDPYPGSTINRYFDDISNPNSRTYQDISTYIAVENISDSAATMTADLSSDTQPPAIDDITFYPANRIVNEENFNEEDFLKPYVTNTRIFTIAAIATDSESGVKEDSYRFWFQQSNDEGSIQNDAPWSTVPNPSGLSMATVTVPADGVYRFKISVSDNAGNNSTSIDWIDVLSLVLEGIDVDNISTSTLISSFIQVDTQPPTAPVISSPSHPDINKWYTTNTPSFTWTVPDDASGITGYSYLIDQNSSTIPNDAIEGTNTAYTYNVPIADGTYYFHIRARDYAGNWSSANHYKIQVDTKPPTALVISSPSYPDMNKWYATNTPPSFTWTASLDTASGLAGYSYLIDQNSSTIPDGTIEGTNTSYTHNAPLADGTYYFHIRARDYAGNWNNASHYKIQVDTQSPSAPVISSSSHPDQNKWSAITPSFTWTASLDDASGLAGYSYLIDQNSSTIPTDDTIVEGTNTAYTHNAPLTDGTYYFHIRARDYAGNWSSASHYKIQVDTQPPAISVISSSSHPNQNKWYTANTPSITWIASDIASGLAGYSYLIDQNSSTMPDDTIVEGTNTTYTHNLPLADGTYYFHIRAKDYVGNWSNTSHYKIQIDTKSPTIPVISSSSHPDQNKWYATNIPSLIWTASLDTASGLAGYSYLIDKTSFTIPDDVIEGTNTAYTHNAPLADGTYYFHIIAKDYAGNWSGVSHYKIQIDTQPPTTPIISSSSHPDQDKWYATIPSFTWTASLDDASGLAGYSYLIDQNSSTIPDDTMYTYNVPITDGTYYFHIRARDYAGNWSSANHYKIQVDTQPPTIHAISSSSHPDQNKWYTANTPSITWIASDIASGLAGYSYLIDQNSSTIPDGTIEGTNTAYTHNLSLADGTYYFHVMIKDYAGNWSGTSHYKIQIDTQPPTTPIISSPSHPDQNNWYTTNTPPSFTWTASDAASGLAGYSYLIDQNSSTMPDGTIEGTNTAYTHNAPLTDGTYYFHIRAMDYAGNWSGTSHYKIQVDIPDTGTLTVTSTPPGAKIYIDDIDTGQVTNWTFTNLTIGTHTIKLTLSGYPDWRKTALIVANSNTNLISATLTTLTQQLLVFPNPFKPSKGEKVTFQVLMDNASISIYNLAGELAWEEQGVNTWNGRNKDGEPVASGTYIYIITDGNGNNKKTGKVAVIW